MKQWIIRIVIGHVILLSAGFAFAAYKLGWFAQWTQNKVDQVVHISCPDLSVGCQFKINTQPFHIRSTAPIVSSAPVTLELMGETQEVHLRWEMQGMAMSSNRYRMLNADKNVWTAETALPICSQQRKDWLLTLELNNAQVMIQTQSNG